jgi:oxalate decarboxylase
MGDNSFQNNVPDPLLSGKELPTFKFELEKSKGKVLGNSFGKEVTIDQLPISKGISGVSMQLEPGVMRELHWHRRLRIGRSFRVDCRKSSGCSRHKF